MKTHASTGLSVVLVTLAISGNAMAHSENEVALAAQFKQLDQDGDGFISVAEVKSQPQLTRFMNLSNYGGFEMADANEDGRLDMVEFVAAEEDIPAE